MSEITHPDLSICRQSAGPASGLLVGWRLPPGQGIVAWVAGTGETVIVPDTRLDPRRYQDIDQVTGMECRSILAGPLVVNNGAIGVIEVVDTKADRFTQAELRFMTLLWPTAAVAMGNARLHQRAEEAAMLEERQPLARDLHDSVTQLLYSAALQAEGYRRLAATGEVENAQEWFADLGNLAHQALSEMRLLLYELGPSMLQQEGLAVTLRHRLEAVEGRVGIRTCLEVEDGLRPPARTEEALYGIAEEALNNALSHSRASSVLVRLRAYPDTVVLEVVDDGSGTDLETTASKRGMGLANMRVRASRIGGSLDIHSAPGEGTSVSVSAETR